MSKAISYLVVGVVAFFAGGLGFHVVGATGEQAAGIKSAENRTSTTQTSATAREFQIEGMMCQGCADSIAGAINKLRGVQSVKVSLADKRALVVASTSEVPTEMILAAISAVGYKAQPATGGQDQSAARATSAMPPILINLTHGKNDLHPACMAIKLAHTALKDGRSVVVFLSIEAPTLAAKTLGNNVQYADFPPVKKMLADFIAAGGRVMVCEHCAHLAKLGQEDIVDGATIITAGKLLKTLAPGTVVLSY
jgi:uncharacterized protein